MPPISPTKISSGWTQPFCIHCSIAFALGQGKVPNTIPVQLSSDFEPDHCIVCKKETRIYLRLDPKLTEQLR